MRRHDRVFLRYGTPFRSACAEIEPAVQACVREWIDAGRPLVAARQASAASGVVLGLTLPTAQGRKRLGVLVEPRDISVVRAPLSLADCLQRLPTHEAEALRGLERNMGRLGVVPGVYGSLAWEALSGEGYRHSESDVDLICDVASVGQAEACLRLLADGAAALPCGLDGEIRFPDGCAVAWRELAAVWGKADAKVLVKGGVDVGLLPLSVVLEQFEEDALHV